MLKYLKSIDYGYNITIDNKKKETRRDWYLGNKAVFSRQYLDPFNYSYEGGWFKDRPNRNALENAYVKSKKPKETK